MSNLATAAELLHTTPQLPVSWYFDPAVLALEQKRLFEKSPAYVGHELMVPNPGDYYSLEWMDHAKALVHNQQGISLLSNVCRHRQAIMLKGSGNTPNIVCPLHRWTYKLDGTLLGAPHFPGNPCLDLGSSPLQNWHGMLFTGKREVAKDFVRLGVAEDLDFSGYKLDRVVAHEHAFNWKTFIEVYLEDYHVEAFHPGLRGFVDCEELKWEYGDWYSVQTVGVKRALQKPGSAAYKIWHDAVLERHGGKPPKQGAIWLVYYPNIMIEWYPDVLVISTLLPKGADACTNVIEFYYPEDIVLFEREFVEAQQQAYHETAAEDEEICVRMSEGRRALWKRGETDAGPYQSPMEDGMVHFHEFLRRELL
ncbi:MAG: aromatic ring-hydroxylating dioxygenase subunit alpha [Burkholderiales bacterium]